MSDVHVLHESYYNRNGEAFVFPLKVNARRLQQRGYRLRFFSSLTAAALDCSFLCVSSKFFREWWSRDEGRQILNLLVSVRARGTRVIWFDISDSSGTTHFKVLPAVDVYAKSLVLKDRAAYRQSMYGSRTFTDFYHRHFGVDDTDSGAPHLNHIPETADLEKICVSWNSGLAHYGLWGVALGKLWHKTGLRPMYPRRWHTPSNGRARALSCRIGERYSRATVARSRQDIRRLVDRYAECGKVPRRLYFNELKQSRAALTPFGLGEISCRDFEVVLCGAAQIKQDMGHVETWPNLWVANQTYIPFRWDLSDLPAVLERVAGDSGQTAEIADNAQQTYHHVIATEDGQHEFCRRFIDLITETRQ